jgi:hypothetical protein
MAWNEATIWRACTKHGDDRVRRRGRMRHSAMETTRRAGCRHTGRQTATGSIRYYQVLSGGRGHTEAFQKGAQGEQAPQGAANG